MLRACLRSGAEGEQRKLSPSWFTSYLKQQKLNTKVKTTELLEYVIQENLKNVELGNKFLGNQKKHEPWKNKLRTWFLKIWKFLLFKDTVKKAKRQATNWKEIILNTYTKNDYKPKYIKNSYNNNNKNNKT